MRTLVYLLVTLKIILAEHPSPIVEKKKDDDDRAELHPPLVHENKHGDDTAELPRPLVFENKHHNQREDIDVKIKTEIGTYSESTDNLQNHDLSEPSQRSTLGLMSSLALLSHSSAEFISCKCQF